MGPVRLLALVALVAIAGPSRAAPDESPDADAVPPGSVDPRALAESAADPRRGERLRIAVVTGADSLAEAFASAGSVAAALRADPGRRSAWVAAWARSWRVIAGGVRATFAAGAVVGRAGSALAPATSPPRAGLVRVAPSTSLWLPTRGVAVEARRGTLALAAVAWAGEEPLALGMGEWRGQRWRAAAMAGRVDGVAGREVLASAALGARVDGCDALVEAGARGDAVHAVVRARFGSRPRWTLELGTSAAVAGFGAATAAPGVDNRRRLRMAVTRTGRAGPVRVRTSAWSVTDRDLDASRRQLRCDVETWWSGGGGRVTAGVRFDRDERVALPFATEAEGAAAEPEHRARLRAGYETGAGALRQSMRVSVLLGPGAARGTLLEWGLRWSVRRLRVAARANASALAPGQRAWFARPTVLGREGLGVATGTVSDAAVRVALRVRGIELTAWVGAGSRREPRAYVGAAWSR
jgi:hypothetical protein